jgi:hypothetical protein
VRNKNQLQQDFLRAALPPEDRRTKLSPVKALLVLFRNLLVSREPIYGVGEWAARYAREIRRKCKPDSRKVGFTAAIEVGVSEVRIDCQGLSIVRCGLVHGRPGSYWIAS